MVPADIWMEGENNGGTTSRPTFHSHGSSLHCCIIYMQKLSHFYIFITFDEIIFANIKQILYTRMTI